MKTFLVEFAVKREPVTVAANSRGSAKQRAVKKVRGRFSYNYFMANITRVQEIKNDNYADRKAND
jgi:hypothetical protein